MANQPTMSGLAFLQALIAKYGRQRAVDLVLLADRAVKNGLFGTRREAANEIERQMGLPVTTEEDVRGGH